jgi:phage gpG-like protein
MDGYGIEYSIHGVPQMQHVLVGIRDRALNGAPVLAVILQDMRRLEQELFETEGRGEWPELAASTLQSKARQGYSSKILQATEALYDSLGGNLSAAGHVEQVTDSEIVFGTTVPYARYLQEGTSKMPARPPVDVREEDIRRWSGMVHSYIFGVDRAEIEAAGGGGLPFSLGLTEPFGVL